jgi:hypothetical protein
MRSLFLVAAIVASVATMPAHARETDAHIKQRLIRQSIAANPGSCACPYSTARNGSRCGGRSAWSRRGGYAPLCYPADISKQQVEAAR